MILDLVRVAVLLVVTFIYAMFDLFNKRNLPDWFAYVSVGLGLLLTLSYGYNIVLFESLALAVAIGSLGYIGYRAGYIGLGDVFEFVFISLVVPLQSLPYLVNLPQEGLPFALSVLIAAGYLAGLTMPIYYVRKAGAKKSIALHMGHQKRRMVLSIFILFMYAVLIVLLALMGPFRLVSIILVSLIAIPAFIVLRYGDSISHGMVELVYPKQLVDGDMIATSMMDAKDIAYFKAKAKSFGILADSKLIAKIKDVRKKIPVYKNAIPLALFIFAGVVVSLLFGNILLLIVFNTLTG